ncbi:ADP-ribosylglycohydrolase family protein [Fimbriiglobus ruber]|uniref:Putative hydrolase n=1 Tax=Fimbriiglobus ruber TaxID=1908690 RepID=A0A225DFB4_9BACT|nr:ADP-ribosylglycohydrolase family protein [Fimbriiglobus ruber]OWK40240.1 putative hydrolase [Fimbriiglobus ruber]
MANRAQTADAIRARFATVEALIAYPQDEIWYTDDTQMAIGVAETLVEHGRIVEDALCRAFVANYVSSRGYARGARMVLNAMEEGRDYRRLAEEYFPGGSFGNGAAMRVAPVGLLFRDDYRRLKAEARAQSTPTHTHPLGIEGAHLLALAVALCTQVAAFDRVAFFAELVAACESAEFRDQIRLAEQSRTVADLAALGNQITALHSVPTAIASFALTPESFAETIGNVILLGGDTDTLAAMAGALSGAYLGASRLPPRLVLLLEASPKGGAYLVKLAHALFDRYEQTPRFPG